MSSHVRFETTSFLQGWLEHRLCHVNVRPPAPAPLHPPFPTRHRANLTIHRRDKDHGPRLNILLITCRVVCFCVLVVHSLFVSVVRNHGTLGGEFKRPPVHDWKEQAMRHRETEKTYKHRLTIHPQSPGRSHTCKIKSIAEVSLLWRAGSLAKHEQQEHHELSRAKCSPAE